MEWSGRTTGYRDYSRDHIVSAEGRPGLACSSDPAFRGNSARWNPEQLFVASVAACHKLWFLHLAAEAGVVVSGYRDEAEGVMDESDGRFAAVTLRPAVTLERGDPASLSALHEAAHARCFIARSIAVPVRIEPL